MECCWWFALFVVQSVFFRKHQSLLIVPFRASLLASCSAHHGESWPTERGSLRCGGAVCVLHIKPFFLPVDTHHDRCPCRFINPREIRAMWPPQRYLIVTRVCSKQIKQRNVVSLYWIRQTRCTHCMNYRWQENRERHEDFSPYTGSLPHPSYRTNTQQHFGDSTINLKVQTATYRRSIMLMAVWLCVVPPVPGKCIHTRKLKTTCNFYQVTNTGDHS